MNYLTLKDLEDYPQIQFITNQIFEQICQEILGQEICYNQSWIEQGIVDEIDLAAILIAIETKLQILLPDKIVVKIFSLENTPPDFTMLNRLKNLNKLVP